MTAATAAAAIAQAIKASGVIVKMDPDEFQRVLWKAEHPLVVTSETRFFGVKYHYLFGYRGLAFYTKTDTPLRLSGTVETVRAKSIWMPQ